MELLLRIHAAGGWTDDVVVGAEPDHTVGELAAAIAEHLRVPGDAEDRIGLRLVRTGADLDPTALVGEIRLVGGDELHVLVGRSRAGAPVAEGVAGGADAGVAPVATIAVDVVGGPDAGRSLRVDPVRHRTVTVGRSRGADLSVADPTVSRHHLTIRLDASGGGRAVIVPAARTPNGVTVDGVEIDGPTEIDEDRVVGLGGTRLAVRQVQVPGDRRPARNGRIEFHRTPYRPPVVVARPTAPIGPIPQRSAPRRVQVLAVVAPVVAGVAMWAFTRQLQFLALTLVSPLVMVATALEDRRSGRRDAKRQVREFRELLVAERRELDELRRLERIDRHRAAPDLADLIRRAEARTSALWARGRVAPDFLVLRLGSGSSRCRFAIELEPGGDDDLRREAVAALDGVDRLDDVPVTVDLQTDAVLGVHGDHDLVDGVVASLAVQAAALHSPEDLAIAAAVGAGRPFGWLAWLPHLRSVASPLAGDHLVTSRTAADALVDRLVEVAVFRLADGPDQVGERCWPRLLVLLDGDLAPDPAKVARLLDLAPAAGISVVWFAGRAADVCRQATRTLRLAIGTDGAATGRLWSTDPGVDDVSLQAERLRPDLADRAARALAPLRDASTASLATSIPRTVPLLAVLGVERPDASWVVDHWRRSPLDGLTFPIGVGADGRVVLDLVEHGPHTLIGGTSGAGKSELLQSMVVALAAHHPPTRLNFLFVDYKGGASTQVFEALPHTVGYVTNLSAELALRALTSLRAEVHRRMAMMEGRAKDLREMLAVAPDEAPPSLVIVIDEFATLATEVPEFVAGVVDVAQRGRSLGIHLVLATQRPTGAVDEDILANTNLRIALRVLDRSESSAIIGSPDAADIPVPLRGRCFARLGPSQVVELQSAHAGAALVARARTGVTVESFVAGDRRTGAIVPAGAAAGPADAVTHLAATIEAIVAADRALDLPAARRPWRDVLPAVVTLDDVVAAASERHPGRRIVVGLLDVPEEQDQRPAVIDLEEGGGLLVFGSGGSGKTTLLRSIAAGIERSAGASTLVLDFASRGLHALRALPSVIDVATSDDLEAVTRHLLRLDGELTRRRAMLADVGAEHLTAYNDAVGSVGGPALDRIVLLVDGFGGLAASLLEGNPLIGATQDWTDLVRRIVVDGRQVGVHAVIAADRRNDVPARLQAAIGPRLVLRHADDAGYADHGVSRERAGALAGVPGRALLGRALVQLASVSRDPTARSQTATIADRARTSSRRPANALGSAALPDRLEIDGIPPVGPAVVSAGPRAVVGVVDVSGEPAVVDLAWTHAVVCGPARSGRSTALATIDHVLREGGARAPEVFAVGPSSSPLARLTVLSQRSAFGRPDVVAPFVARLADVACASAPATTVVLVDDADGLDDPLLDLAWERLVGLDHVRFVVAVEPRSMAGYSASPLVGLARRARCQLLLQPDDPAEVLQLTGVRCPVRPGLRLAPGRGILVADRRAAVVQLALPPFDLCQTQVERVGLDGVHP